MHFRRAALILPDIRRRRFLGAILFWLQRILRATRNSKWKLPYCNSAKVHCSSIAFLMRLWSPGLRCYPMTNQNMWLLRSNPQVCHRGWCPYKHSCYRGHLLFPIYSTVTLTRRKISQRSHLQSVCHSYSARAGLPMAAWRKW